MDKESWKLQKITTEIVERSLSEIPLNGLDTESECEGDDEDAVSALLRDRRRASVVVGRTNITDLHNAFEGATVDEDMEVDLFIHFVHTKE